MTDRDALIAACKASPDDDTPRLVYLDWLEEMDGVTDFTTATREFYAKCREPRRYENTGEVPKGQYVYGDMKVRRILPGWREWLSCDEKENVICRKFDGSPNYWGVSRANWMRLVPSLWPLLKHRDNWQRRKGTVVIRHTLERHHIRLIFARGWLARVSFLPRRLADSILLPAILTDQPFVVSTLDQTSAQPISGRSETQ